MPARARTPKSVNARPHAANQKDARGRDAATGQFVNMKISDPAARKDLDALKRELTGSPEKAAEFLRQVGILTPTGRLSRKFGG